MPRDNEGILRASAEGADQIRRTAIALLEAGASFSYVMEVLGAAQVLQEAVSRLSEPNRPERISSRPLNGELVATSCLPEPNHR